MVELWWNYNGMMLELCWNYDRIMIELWRNDMIILMITMIIILNYNLTNHNCDNYSNNYESLTI